MKNFLLHRGLLPDFWVRRSIRHRLDRRLKEASKGGPSASERRLVELVDELKKEPITIQNAMNSKRESLPPLFFEKVLGKNMKASSGFWREGVEDIHISETDMLEMMAWRADIRDGQRILELGSGWGAFSLFAARKFPSSQIISLTGSSAQKDYIQSKIEERGITNLTVLAEPVDDFKTSEMFDRVVSIELFEKVRNYEMLLEKIAALLNPQGKLFMHLFCHKSYAYLHDADNPKDWVERYFLTGGVMPSETMLLYFDRHFQIEQRWKVPGQHYRRTCRAWLARMDSQKKEVFEIFRQVYGKEARKWWAIWRVFFMAGEEHFGYNKGQEWFVSHYLFRKK